MSSVLRFASVILALLPAACAVAQTRPAEPRVVGSLQDFESSRPGVFTVYRQLAGSELEIIAAPHAGVIEGSRSLRVRIGPTEKPQPGPHIIGTLGAIYLPPEADAVRAKVRMKSGRATLTLGGPTVYFGNSDVLLEPQTIAGDGRTFVVEWSLHHRSSRNFRRLNPALTYGRDMSFIHYARWVQEPVRLVLMSPPAGDPGCEFVVDSFELVARGEGRPYPRIADADCTSHGEIDFAAGVSQAFTFTLAGGRDIRPPPKLSHVDAPAGKALRVECRFVEETAVAGIRVAEPPPAATNALAIDLTAEHPRQSPLVLDVLVITAAPGTTFPGGAGGFDHDFSNPAMAGKDYAVYHARRQLGKDPVLIPFADFACLYGQGTFKPAMTDNTPIDPARIAAIGVLVPFGFNSDVSTLTIQRLRWLSVPGTPAELRSYRQPTGKVTITRETQGAYGGTARQAEEGTPGKVEPVEVP